jgi:FMN phosphatase YigB (HAD superfamily)
VDNANLRQYFDAIVISAEEGIRKPDRRIYNKALSLTESKSNASAVRKRSPGVSTLVVP